MNQQTTTLLVYVAVVILIVFRQLRERRIRPGPTLWIFPVLLLVIAALPLTVENLTSAADITLFAVAALLGIPLGFWQQTHSAIRVDRDAGFLYVKSNPLGILVFLAAFVLRAAIRFMTGGIGSTGTAELWSTAALFFAVGMLFGMRIYWQRAYATTAS
jgi:hypothetical protein